MASSRLFFFLPLLMSLLIPSAHSCNLFVEYIGALFTGVKFTDVPINPGITNFQFILAFGIDYTASAPHTPTNGLFNVFWDNNNLGASQIAAIKASHPNVKVALSLGGDTVDKTPVQFNPTSIDTWVANAVSSFTGLANQYHLDGIDIDYEHFGTDHNTFAECIGRLITTLKNNGVIKFASIAPFPAVDDYYTTLWKKYGSVIDNINYQFYACPSSTNVSQFLGYFDAASDKYSGGNVLVSFSTASDACGLLPADKGFWNAANTLKSQGKLHGIFVWTADASKNNGFAWDIQAQSVIVG